MFEIDMSAWEQTIDKLENKARSFEKLKDEIGLAIKNTILLDFKQAQSPYGEKWQPLKWRSGEPLRDTGALRASISYEVVGNAIIVGYAKEYGKYHNEGTGIYNGGKPYTVKPKNKQALFFKGAQSPFKSAVIDGVPKRQFMPYGGQELPASYIKVIFSTIEDYLSKK